MKKSDDLVIWIMNVGRGLSVLIKTPHNYCVIYDLGSSSDNSPLEIYKKNKVWDLFEPFENKKIAQCIISHPHADHISDLTEEHTTFIKDASSYITCQNDKSEYTGKGDKSDYNQKGHKIKLERINNRKEDAELIDNYKSLYEKRNLPLVTINPTIDGVDFQMGYYYITAKTAEEMYPNSDQDYSNALSIVLYLRYKGTSILIPGDITPDALAKIFEGQCEKRFTDYSKKMNNQAREKWARTTDNQPNLRNLILNHGLTFLLAPHHGLESCYPRCLEMLLNEVKEEKGKFPKLILLSDKTHTAPNSGKTDSRYQNGTLSTGLMVNGEKRKSLSTIHDGNIKISINQDKIDVKTAKNESVKELFK